MRVFKPIPRDTVKLKLYLRECEDECHHYAQIDAHILQQISFWSNHPTRRETIWMSDWYDKDVIILSDLRKEILWACEQYSIIPDLSSSCVFDWFGELNDPVLNK